MSEHKLKCKFICVKGLPYKALTSLSTRNYDNRYSASIHLTSDRLAWWYEKKN